MAYKNTLLTGITDFLVLSILKIKGDCYAYENILQVNQISYSLFPLIPYIPSCINWKMNT